jgi:hypothetical protein
MKITTKQIESVIRLPSPKRYDYFIKRIADSQTAWGLYATGWAMAETSAGELVFPIWPASEYAGLCAVGDWAHFAPKEIDIEDLLDGLLPSLVERSTKLGVFYTPEDKGTMPDLALFQADLRRELAKFG